MKYSYEENAVESTLLLRINEDNFDKYFFKNRNERFLTIAWNRGEEQTAWVDEVAYHFPKNSILALMVNQSFRFERPADLVSWQFNREFYCIVDHDREVSCVGFLFYGMRDLLFINLDEKNATRLDL